MTDNALSWRSGRRRRAIAWLAFFKRQIGGVPPARRPAGRHRLERGGSAKADADQRGAPRFATARRNVHASAPLHRSRTRGLRTSARRAIAGKRRRSQTGVREIAAQAETVVHCRSQTQRLFPRDPARVRATRRCQLLPRRRPTLIGPARNVPAPTSSLRAPVPSLTLISPSCLPVPLAGRGRDRPKPRPTERGHQLPRLRKRLGLLVHALSVESPTATTACRPARLAVLRQLLQIASGPGGHLSLQGLPEILGGFADPTFRAASPASPAPLLQMTPIVGSAMIIFSKRVRARFP